MHSKKCGFIEDITLSTDDLKETAKDFISFCDRLNFHPSGFSLPQYEVKLHSDKVDERLQSFFKEFNPKIDKEGFYHLPEEIANGYMFFLSNTVSKRRNIPKLTDNSDMFAAMLYFDADGEYDSFTVDTEKSEIMTSVVLRSIIPNNIELIDFEDLTKMYLKLSSAKRRFS